MYSDNRRSLRVSAHANLAEAIVRLDCRKTLACEVLNKSSGGYGIAVPMEYVASFPPGRLLILDVDELVLQVKVAHAAEDPDEDRYLIGLECIAELEDKTLARQLQPSWWSALRCSSGQGLGGQTAVPRDVVMAIMLCCTLLALALLPSLMERLKGKKGQQRATSASTTFSFPWNWPSSRRTYIPKAILPDDPQTGLPNTGVTVPGTVAPAVGPVSAVGSGGGSSTPAGNK